MTKRTDGVLAIGQSTLYPMRYNIEAKGLIKPECRKGNTGRERKHYRLTGKGKTRL